MYLQIWYFGEYSSVRYDVLKVCIINFKRVLFVYVRYNISSVLHTKLRRFGKKLGR